MFAERAAHSVTRFRAWRSYYAGSSARAFARFCGLGLLERFGELAEQGGDAGDIHEGLRSCAVVAVRCLVMVGFAVMKAVLFLAGLLLGCETQASMGEPAHQPDPIFAPVVTTVPVAATAQPVPRATEDPWRHKLEARAQIPIGCPESDWVGTFFLQVTQATGNCGSMDPTEFSFTEHMPNRSCRVIAESWEELCSFSRTVDCSEKNRSVTLIFLAKAADANHRSGTLLIQAFDENTKPICSGRYVANWSRK